MPNPAKTSPLPEIKRVPPLKVPAFLFRLVLLTGLAVLLFLAGFYTESLFSFFTEGFNRLFFHLNAYGLLSGNTFSTSAFITKRSFPAMLLYGFGYTALSYLLLHVYFRNRKNRMLAAGFYGAVFLSCLVLVLLGSFIPDLAAALRLARRLIEFIVSPFPVVLLIAASKAFPAKDEKGAVKPLERT